METPFREDVEHYRNMVDGSLALWQAINRGHALSSKFKWTERSNGGTLQASEGLRHYRTQGERRAAQSFEQKQDALTRRVSRDPCPVCATRMDIGCEHRRVA